MRKHLIWVAALALVVGVASVAFAAQKHTVKAKIAPANQKKDKYGAASFNFTTASTCTGEGCKLNAANRVRVYIDDDVKLTTKGLARCTKQQLEETTTAQAEAKCAKAKVGEGKSIAFIGGDPNAAVEGKGTTFNGPPKNGRPTLLVHNRIQAFGLTTVLVGVYKPGQGDFGTVLDVSVPPLPLNTALASFQQKIQRSFKFKGKTRHYISARCFDNNRTWNFKGRDDYGGGEPPLTASVTQKCTVKR